MPSLLLLLTVEAALATTCTRLAPPVVMGGVDHLVIPPDGVFQVAWREAPQPWPPRLVLSDATKPHEPELTGHETVAITYRELMSSAPTSGSVTAIAYPSEPLTPGSTWNLYMWVGDLGWMTWTRVSVAINLSRHSWNYSPVVRTSAGGLAAVESPSLGLDAFYRSGVTQLFVPADATDASFIAAWIGEVGTPIDYTRAPAFVAPRHPEGFYIGSIGICEPTLMQVPLTGGERLRYGLRPFDTAGRSGDAIEVNLSSAREQEVRDRHTANEAAAAACLGEVPLLRSEWRTAEQRALDELTRALPRCVDAVKLGVQAPEFRPCIARPEFERAKNVAAVTDALDRATTPLEVRAAIIMGEELPISWRPLSSITQSACDPPAPASLK